MKKNSKFRNTRRVVYGIFNLTFSNYPMKIGIWLEMQKSACAVNQSGSEIKDYKAFVPQTVVKKHI
jgi:hypothetical protein